MRHLKGTITLGMSTSTMNSDNKYFNSLIVQTKRVKTENDQNDSED